MATSKLREKDIEAYLRKVTKAHGGEAYKWSSPGRRSVPDRIALIPCFDESILFIEVKAEGQEPTLAQEREHERLRALGGTVLVVDSKAQVDLIFELNCEFEEHKNLDS